MSEDHYLENRKNLYFDNPRGFLLIGYDLSPEHQKSLRRKQRSNPRITILTYNDVVALAKNTAQKIKDLIPSSD